MREFREGGAGAGFPAEKLDEDALVERRVLIDENADGFACFESFQNAAGGVFFLDDVVAAEGSVALDERVNARIVERADDDVHRRGHPGVGERAEFPVAQVGGGNEDSSALGESGLEVFQAVITNQRGNVLGRKARQAGEGGEQTRDGKENAVGYFVRVRVSGHGQVFCRDAAEAGDENIDKPCDEDREGRKERYDCDCGARNQIFKQSSHRRGPVRRNKKPRLGRE